MKKLLPVILAVIGLGIGTGAGVFLKPGTTENTAKGSQHSAEKTTINAISTDGKASEKPPSGSEGISAEGKPSSKSGPQANSNSSEGHEFVKLNNQFVVPVVNGTKVTSLVVMSLSIEVASGEKETVFAREPKLRDAFLQVLFNHANSGGFSGEFTGTEKMRDLRGSLLEAAKGIIGPAAFNVLVIGILRQDV